MSNTLTSQIIADENPLANVVVAKNGTLEFTESQLRHYFELVQNTTNWKNPITRTVQVPCETLGRDIIGIYEAVRFYTGCIPHICVVPNGGATHVNGKGVAVELVHVVAAGYYAAVGA